VVSLPYIKFNVYSEYNLPNIRRCNVEISDELKNKLKEQRLNEYKQRLFVQQMNYEACKSVDDKVGMDTATKGIEQIKQAYKAIEGM
jgi:predicted DNA binding CopG/RHH family protein